MSPEFPNHYRGKSVLMEFRRLSASGITQIGLGGSGSVSVGLVERYFKVQGKQVVAQLSSHSFALKADGVIESYSRHMGKFKPEVFGQGPSKIFSREAYAIAARMVLRTWEYLRRPIVPWRN